jgi:hypothetical protein
LLKDVLIIEEMDVRRQRFLIPLDERDSRTPDRPASP